MTGMTSLFQATSTRDHLLEAAAQKQVEVKKQVEMYASLGADMKQVWVHVSAYLYLCRCACA